MRKTLALTVAAAAVGLALTGAAQAQDGPGMRHGMRGDPPTAAERQAMEARMDARHAQRKADLKTVLRLRPDQDRALDAFLEAMRPPMRPEGPAAPAAGKAPLTTPERLDRMAQMKARREQMGEKRVDALKTFYAALSPEQRQVFDALGRMRAAGGGSGHGGGKMRMGHGFGPPPGGPPPV